MRRWISVGVVWCVAFLLMCSTALASFHIVSDSLEFDSTNRTTTFTVRFDRAPDFVTTDLYGRQKDSFQYFVDSQVKGNLFAPNPDVTIVRAEEIHAADALRIRDSVGDDTGATSGGWGPIRATVPFTVSGDTVQFTASWDALGQAGTHFRYGLESYEFGSMNDERVRLIPLPPAFWAGGVTLGFVVLFQVLSAQHRKHLNHGGTKPRRDL